MNEEKEIQTSETESTEDLGFDYRALLDKIVAENNLDEVQEEETPKVEKAPETKRVAKKVSKDDIIVIQSNELEKEKDLKAILFGSKSATQIVAPQSGYMAQINPLVHKDVVSLMYSNLSRAEYRKAIYKVIYDKIALISSEKPKPSFEEWLRMTSIEDIETFCYGVYCSTFPGTGSFIFECPHCEEENKIKILNGSLTRVTDSDSMKKRIDTITKTSYSPEARKKLSFLGDTELYELSDSKLRFELRTPSLWDSLEILKTVPEKLLDKDITSITNMLYIKKFLIPSKKKENAYSEQKDYQEILRIIDNLSIDDSEELREAVTERVESNRISYSIKNLKCPHCNHVVEETYVNMEDILFTQIYEKAL